MLTLALTLHGEATNTTTTTAAPKVEADSASMAIVDLASATGRVVGPVGELKSPGASWLVVDCSVDWHIALSLSKYCSCRQSNLNRK